MSSTHAAPSRLFVSYVKEDRDTVRRLVAALRDAGFEVWWDQEIPGGRDWRDWIAEHISQDDFWVPCFSTNLAARDESYFYEELHQAIERMRQMPPSRVWLMPVRLDECTLPRIHVTPTKRLSDYQWTNVFLDGWNDGITRLVAWLRGAFGEAAPSLAPTRSRVITTADRALALSEGVFDMVAGRLHVLVNFRDVAYALGWDQKSAPSALDYASGQGYIKPGALGGWVGLEPLGIDAIEEARGLPQHLRTEARGMVFLAMSYVQADGRPGCFLSGRSVAAALRWGEPDFITVHSYLQACAAFDHQGIGGMFSLSTYALDRIENFLQELVVVPTAQTVADLVPHVEEPLLDLARQQALAVEATVERTTQLHMRLLQAAVDRFRAETGQLPSALTELTKDGPLAPFGGYLCEVPDHPAGGGYELDPATGQVHETGQKDDAS